MYFLKATIYRKSEKQLAYISTKLLICAQVIPTLINPMTVCSDMQKKYEHSSLDF